MLIPLNEYIERTTDALTITVFMDIFKIKLKTTDLLIATFVVKMALT